MNNHHQKNDDLVLAAFLKKHARSIHDLPQEQTVSLEKRIFQMVENQHCKTQPRLLDFLRFWGTRQKWRFFLPLAAVTVTALLILISKGLLNKIYFNEHSFSKIEKTELESYVEDSWEQLLSDADQGSLGSEFDEMVSN